MQSSSGLDQIASVLVWNDNAADGRIAAAAVSSVDEEIRSAAHVVAGVWEQLVRVRIALVREHIA
jgi:hypothetical protein